MTKTRTRRRWWGATMLSAWLAAGCGDDTSAANDEGNDDASEQPRARICDGSEDLRLAWFLAPSSGQLRTSFEVELGFYYLYVRGDCRYWVLPYRKASGPARIEARTGVLDDAQEAALAELLHYGDWDGLRDLWLEPGSFDVPVMVVDDGQGQDGIGCMGECPTAPEPVHAMREAFYAELDAKWDAGEALTGPVRVLTALYPPEDTPSLPAQFVVPWTVDLDLESVAVAFDDMWCPGISTLIEDPSTAAALREFRAEHAERLEDFTDFFVEVEPGVVYELYLRDALPFEGDDGLIPQYSGLTESCG